MRNSFRNIVKIFFAVLVFGAVFFFGASANRAHLQQVRAADEPAATELCDIVTDPNCKLPGMESLFPSGSLGEQLFKDTQNEEQAKQLSSTAILANKTDQQPYFCGISVTCYLVELLDWASSALLRVPLVMVAGFLDQAVTLALNLPMDQIGFVVQGWKIIRDVSNMFYVLILLWVALGTIFDFLKYNVREILPKLVISALLINFSLPLGTLVINTTNALANVFYQGIVDAGTGINGEGKGRLLADKILENMNLIQIVEESVKADVAAANQNTQKVTDDALKDLQKTPVLDFWGKPRTDENGTTVTQDCSKLAGLDLTGLANRGAANATGPINIEGALATVLASANAGCRDAMLSYVKKVEAAQSYDLITFARISAIIWKLILIPTLIFVLFAAALFIFIRTISLAFLLVFGPFVFLAWALPETRQYWSQWWDKLLKWSFFMPVLMFMLFLSITMMTTFTGEKSFATTEATQQVLGATEGKTGLATPGFFTANMHFLFMLMLLIGSLTVAEKMGIEMAAQVRGLGQKALGRAKKMAKAPTRIARLNLQSALGKGTKTIAESEAFTKLVNLPIVGALGGRYAARTLAQIERTGETAATTRLKEKYGGDVTRMRPEQQAALFATGAPGEITGFYKKLDFEDQQALWRTMNARQKDAAREKLIRGGISKRDIDRASGNFEQLAVENNPSIASLKGFTASNDYNKAIIDELRKMGAEFKNASPEFIKSDIGKELLKTITSAEMQEIATNKTGFKALNEVIKDNNLMGVPTIPVSNNFKEYLKTIPGRSLLKGDYKEQSPSEYARLAKMLKAMNEKIEGGGGSKIPPPPSGHIPGAT